MTLFEHPFTAQHDFNSKMRAYEDAGDMYYFFSCNPACLF